MSEHCEEEQVVSSLSPVDDGYKVRPPSKKKYEEDMERLVSQIREREAELDKIKVAGGLNITGELKNLKVEKSAAIAKRKYIDTELEKLKKILPEKMHQLVQLESSLIYKSDEKINAAIQRLEWNLKVQPFKLMEEKKIVSEIDRLKRSKKTLVQYLALKQDISAIRDMQRGMREERDTYFQAVGKLNSDEDKLRRNCTSAKGTFSVLKSEIDELYESKRQLVANYKKQIDEYQGTRDKQRKGSWKKREDYRKSSVTDRRRQQVEFEVEKTPYEKYISWCNSLIKVLSRYNSLGSQETSLDSLSPASSMEEPELAEEIGDGQYILLKKNGEGFEQSVGTKRPSKKNRRPRKQSSIKKVTLSSDMVQQLTELGLRTPNSMAEVTPAIESLRLKKVLLEQEQQSSEVASDAGISATESLICEMSRQASKTESFEGTVDTNPGEHVYAEILRKSMVDQPDHPECYEAEGAVGGCDENSGILSPNSDSTVEGDTGSSESQSSVFKNPESASCEYSRPVVIVFNAEGEESEGTIPAEKSEPGHIHRMLKSTDLLSAPQKQTLVLPENQQKSVPSDVNCRSQSDMSVGNVDYVSEPISREHVPAAGGLRNAEKPICLFISPASFPERQQGLPSTSSVDFPCLATTSMSPTAGLSQHVSHSHQGLPSTSSVDFPCLATTSMSPTAGLSQSVSRSVWNSPADTLRLVHQGSNLPSTPSPAQSHCTLAARLSNSSTGRTGHTQPMLTVPVSQSQPGLLLDNEDFPSLSQSMRQPRRGSTLSTKSSSGSSCLQEQLSLSCDQHPTAPITKQVTGSELPGQTHTPPVFLAPQNQRPQTLNEELDSNLPSPKCSEPRPHSDKLLSMSHIPSMDKSSTEKWVESSVAFVQELIPDHCEDDVTATLTESTRL